MSMVLWFHKFLDVDGSIGFMVSYSGFVVSIVS